MERNIGTGGRLGLLSVLTGLLFAMGAATVDLSLPTLPAIQHDIGSAGSRVELTLTMVFFGLALSQLVFGAVADRYGRRTPLIAGLAVYCLATVAAALAPNLVVFGAARLVQALGYGVAVVLSRSAVADVCDERSTARVYSTAITMMAVASVLAPALGGTVLDHFGWRAVFFVMAGFGVLTLAAVALLLPETLPQAQRSRAGFASVFSTYGRLLRNGRFTAFAAISACAASFQFTYNTGAPATVIDHYGISPANAGLLFSLIALSTAVASQVNAVLLKWRSPEFLMFRAILVSVVAGAAVLTSVFTGVGGAVGLIAALFVLLATTGFMAANSMAGAVSSVGMQAGAASALMGVMQFVCGTVGSAAVGAFHDGAGRPMGVVIAALALGAVLIAARFARR